MKYFFLCLITLLSIATFAQSPDQLFVTYSLSNAIPSYNKCCMDGGPSFDGEGSFAMGFRYLLKSEKAVTFETGMDYALHRFSVSPSFYPGIDMSPRAEKLQLLTIPLYANLTFLKYLFVNGGALIDFEFSKNNTIDKQSGIGFGLGLGGKYNFGKISVFVNPFLQRHAFLAFDKEQGARQSLFNSGVRLGVGYRF